MRFFVLGDVSVDLLFFLERIPEPGEEAALRRRRAFLEEPWRPSSQA